MPGPMWGAGGPEEKYERQPQELQLGCGEQTHRHLEEKQSAALF